MARDWNQYYRDSATVDMTPFPLLVELADQLVPGKALDLACGPGRNALYLARLGWQVTAVDSSEAAIGILRRQAQGLAIDAQLADLERDEFAIQPDAFDLICAILYF